MLQPPPERPTLPSASIRMFEARTTALALLCWVWPIAQMMKPGRFSASVFATAKTLAENRPGFIIWAMGQTQHNNANAVVRASNILMLALGNVGRSGGGCNIYRGHDNVQGATDVGPNPDTLPGYYPVAVPGSWAHWARVWNVDLKWLQDRFAPGMMGKPGMTVSRWIDG